MNRITGISVPLDELEAVRAAYPKGGKALTAVAVYVAICELAVLGEDATNESIAARAAASSATVYNYLEELVGTGVIEVERQTRGPYRYHPRAAQAADAIWRQNAAMRSLLNDLGVTPAQIIAREVVA